MLTVLPYDGISPQIDGPVEAATGAAVLGHATLGPGARLGPRAVIRADGHYVQIGRNFSLGAGGTVHISHGTLPTHIGDDVTAGAGAVIHACDVADGCVIEAGAVILDGSTLGEGLILAAGATVFPRSVLEGGWLYQGSPAKPVRRITPDALACARKAVQAQTAPSPTEDGADVVQGAPLFVANSVLVRGDVQLGENTSVFFGCILDGSRHGLRVGAGTNVQDNSVLRSGSAQTVIGTNVTIGHNVTLDSVEVSDGALIGMGAKLAPGTIVGRDVLVAAGTETEPGQVLTDGLLWAGRPARAKRELTAAQRKMMAATLPAYRTYAAQFAQAQTA